MIPDFGSFTRRGLLADLERPADTAGGETIEETVEDKKTTNLPAVRECEVQRLSFNAGDTNDPKCFGFHSVKPRKDFA